MYSCITAKLVLAINKDDPVLAIKTGSSLLKDNAKYPVYVKYRHWHIAIFRGSVLAGYGNDSDERKRKVGRRIQAVIEPPLQQATCCLAEQMPRAQDSLTPNSGRH